MGDLETLILMYAAAAVAMLAILWAFGEFSGKG